MGSQIPTILMPFAGVFLSLYILNKNYVEPLSFSNKKDKATYRYVLFGIDISILIIYTAVIVWIAVINSGDLEKLSTIGNSFLGLFVLVSAIIPVLVMSLLLGSVTNFLLHYLYKLVEQRLLNSKISGKQKPNTLMFNMLIRSAAFTVVSLTTVIIFFSLT